MASSLLIVLLLSCLSVVFCSSAGGIIRAQPHNTRSVTAFPTARPVLLINATISAPYTPSPHPADLAIDGNYNTFAHTALQDGAWFQVTLASPTTVSQIVIINRVDCCQDRIDPSFVFIKATPFIGTTINQLTHEPGVSFGHIDTTASAYTINFPDVMTAYVLIMLDDTNLLNFAEIFVYTTAQPATLAGATISSVYTPFPNPASQAIDGNINTFCHTAIGDYQWLKVDLAQSVNVVQVQVINRVDCCQSRIFPAILFLKNTPFIGTTIAQLSAEPGVTQQSFYAVQDVYSFYFNNVPTTYLWIYQAGTNVPLNLAEVYVF